MVGPAGITTRVFPEIHAEKMLWAIKLVFHDKRLTTVLLLTWMTVSCTIFSMLGAFDNQFMTFGPSDKTVFMAMKIDDWWKWSTLAAFSLVNTTMNEFIGSALGPWFTNTIQVAAKSPANGSM